MEDPPTTQPAIRRRTFAGIAVVGTMWLPRCGRGPSQEKAAAPVAQTEAPATNTTNLPSAPTTAKADRAPAQVAPPAPAVSTPKPATGTESATATRSEPPVGTPAVPAPKPEPIVKAVAAGTDLEVAFLAGASSKTSHAGVALRAKFTNAVVLDGVVVIPEGAIATGMVTEAVPLKKIGGAAGLGVKFDTLELADGTKAGIMTELKEQGKSETG